MESLEGYTAEQMRLSDVHPRSRGLAQVSGRNNLSWEERFALDVWYVDHRSLWLDTKILAMTFRAVLGGEGVSAPGCFSAPEFLGLAARDKNSAAAGDSVKTKSLLSKTDVPDQNVNDT